LSFELWAVS